jgi:hypothetical protein
MFMGDPPGCVGDDVKEDDKDHQAQQPGKDTGRKSGGTRKPKVPVIDQGNCMARVWRTGSGQDQCSRRSQAGSDYCKMHGIKAHVTEKPCQVNRQGKPIGLFFGRIDQERPWLGDDNTIRIEWGDADHKEEVAQALADGSAHR